MKEKGKRIVDPWERVDEELVHSIFETNKTSSDWLSSSSHDMSDDDNDSSSNDASGG